MWVDHPQWVRTCRECQQYVVGPNGVISTYVSKDSSGRLIELPMRRSEAGVPPPCAVCPKARDGGPLEEDADFGDWFFAAQAWYEECRAVGDFGRPDPLMRAVAAAFDVADRRARDRALILALTTALNRRG